MAASRSHQCHTASPLSKTDHLPSTFPDFLKNPEEFPNLEMF
jgi:hypothetical protein